MANSYMLIFAFALLIELTTHSTTALPKMKMDEEHSDQEKILTEDETSENEPMQWTFRKHPIMEGRLVGEDGTKRILILADKGIKASLGKEGNLGFSKTYPELYGTDHPVDGFIMKEERRNIDDVLGVGKREIDMLRCMIGRVYRPCWKV